MGELELPLEHRELVVMKGKGYKDKEIAESLGMPLGTVAGTYSRLKKKLEKCMERASKLKSGVRNLEPNKS
jgi:DNA-directed RNA polymerase specialized sigma24 family protein